MSSPYTSKDLFSAPIITTVTETSHCLATTYDHTHRYPIESYLFYATIERRLDPRSHDTTILDRLIKKTYPHTNDSWVPEDAEQKHDNDSMILRMTSFFSVFCLITTDILGPQNAPYAFSTMGYGKGAGLYFLFAIIGAYCGLLIWRLFMDLNSKTHPVRTFADLAFRLWGKPGKIIVTILHSLYLLLVVALLLLTSAQSLSQIIKNKFCFIALLVFFSVFGALVLAQIKSLKHYSKLSLISVIVIIIGCIIGMVGAVQYPPNYKAAWKQNNEPEGPVRVVASIGGQDQIIGMLNAVYSFAGALLFPEILAEMANPWDFWKGALLSQAVIFCVYIFFGIFMYSHQGQFSINPSAQSISDYKLQSACNVITILAAIIAAGMFSNISIKVLWQNIIMDIFKGPSLTSRTGRISWSGSTIVYWIIAFTVAAAIPQLSAITALAAALCALQFTYSFPALMTVTLQMHKDALIGDGEFDRKTDSCMKQDTWKQKRRWVRGFAGHWKWNVWHIILGFFAIVLAIVGVVGSIVDIVDTFNSEGAPTSFSCSSPV